MPNPLAIDAHAHICTEETMKLLNKETPKIASSLKEIGQGNYEWTVAGVPYRPLPLGGFDIEQRLKDMKASDVDMQVLSNTPQTFLYNQDAGMTTAACVVQNDQIAKHVRDYPRSFYGIATLPMQAPKAAADELERAISKLNLKGMQIGSNINGKNLDEPEFEPVWQVANQHNAFCMVHPNNVAGIERMRNYYLNNLIGNPLDTTIAAACLVFGGVIERYPNIRFYMVHGGGFTPWQTNTTATQATYIGTTGHIYGFYSTATDLVGNSEPPKKTAEATIKLGGAVDVAPAVTANPVSANVNIGATVSFSAASSGTPTPTIQWQVSTNLGSTYANITGATATTYTFTAATSLNGNLYRAVFTNSAGTATTSAAKITVAATALPGDVNSDGIVSCADIRIVIASFGRKAGQAKFDARADVNHDGIVNVMDLRTVSKHLRPGSRCRELGRRHFKKKTSTRDDARH